MVFENHQVGRFLAEDEKPTLGKVVINRTTKKMGAKGFITRTSLAATLPQSLVPKYLIWPNRLVSTALKNKYNGPFLPAYEGDSKPRAAGKYADVARPC